MQPDRGPGAGAVTTAAKVADGEAEATAAAATGAANEVGADGREGAVVPTAAPEGQLPDGPATCAAGALRGGGATGAAAATAAAAAAAAAAGKGAAAAAAAAAAGAHEGSR